MDDAKVADQTVTGTIPVAAGSKHRIRVVYTPWQFGAAVPLR